jgi:16S rRNA (adenine1518-N6/adenine1519-N6)-dimethyltransferase
LGRRLGQHFLIRKSILERIASEVCLEPGLTVVEIGAGKGALTEYLLARAARVIAIETDPLLVDDLAQKFGNTANLTIVKADILKTDLAQWAPAAVAGNLPYYITSPILRKVLALGRLLRSAVVLVQKEVAERLTAQPGSRDYGFLTVETKLFATPEILFRIPPSAFRPPPKVESAAVRLLPGHEIDRLSIDQPARFLDFVGLCFRQKRKILRNNLAGEYSRALLDKHPETSLRAEQLPIHALARLYHRLNAAPGNTNSEPVP